MQILTNILQVDLLKTALSLASMCLVIWSNWVLHQPILQHTIMLWLHTSKTYILLKWWNFPYILTVFMFVIGKKYCKCLHRVIDKEKKSAGFLDWSVKSFTITFLFYKREIFFTKEEIKLGILQERNGCSAEVLVVFNYLLLSRCLLLIKQLSFYKSR